jgi:hypothetical protein
MTSKQLGKIFLATIALLLSVAIPSRSQAQPQASQTGTVPGLSVRSVIIRDGEEFKEAPSNRELRLGGNIRLQVDNLSDWTTAGNSPWNLILFLNERPMRGLHPISVDQEHGYVLFHLERRGDNVPTWNELMERGKDWNWGKVSRILRASVGLDGGIAVQSSATFTMVFLPRLWFFFILAATVFSFCLLVILGRKTALLKAGAQGPFSLSRSQMALWSWLTLNAYLYLYALSHDPAVEIPVSILGLLGISATTYVAAVMVDQSSGGASAEPSLGFIRDVAGGKELSLHRLQMIGWTLVLAFAFVAQVLRALTIPDFNPTLLGLMGLSAGTYVGFKFPENQAAKPDSAAKAAAAGQ